MTPRRDPETAAEFLVNRASMLQNARDWAVFRRYVK